MRAPAGSVRAEARARRRPNTSPLCPPSRTQANRHLGGRVAAPLSATLGRGGHPTPHLESPQPGRDYPVPSTNVTMPRLYFRHTSHHEHAPAVMRVRCCSVVTPSGRDSSDP